MSIIYALIQKYLLINYFMCLAITRDNAVTNKSFSFMNLIFYSDGGKEKTNKNICIICHVEVIPVNYHNEE